MHDQGEERRKDEQLRDLINELEEEDNGSFGILTTEGFRQLTENIHRLARLVLIGMLVQLAVIGYVFWTDYEGRKESVAATREGCERDKADRIVNAEGWRTAEAARRKAHEFKTADRYRDYAVAMEMRGRINCNRKYPKASLLP